jgi:hypothetical protein
MHFLMWEETALCQRGLCHISIMSTHKPQGGHLQLLRWGVFELASLVSSLVGTS